VILAALGLQTSARAANVIVGRPWGQVLGLTLVVVPLALSLSQALNHYAERKEDWRITGQFVDAHFQPGDTVVSPLGGGVLYHYTQSADAGRQDDFSMASLESVSGRLWVVWHPYLGPAGDELQVWLAGQPTVQYQIDSSLSVFVVNAPLAETLTEVPPPETAWAWATLAEQHERRDEASQAESYFQHALALNSAPEFATRYADFLRRQNRSDAAVPYYFEALNQNADFVPALIGLARIYLQRNVLADATRALEWAARFAPDDYAVNYFLAQAYERSGRPADATIHRDRASQLVPDLVEPP
jgi:tetratricopeptide (TPR) repeat protein